VIVYEQRRALPRVALLYAGIEGCVPLLGRRSAPPYGHEPSAVVAPSIV
jgi:hypothetical protein